jgi:hypothetical protein
VASKESVRVEMKNMQAMRLWLCRRMSTRGARESQRARTEGNAATRRAAAACAVDAFGVSMYDRTISTESRRVKVGKLRVSEMRGS